MTPASLPAKRTLIRPVGFVIDVGANGFNAYRVIGDGRLELFAASGSITTLCRVMSDIVFAGTGNRVEFKMAGEGRKEQEEPCTT